MPAETSGRRQATYALAYVVLVGSFFTSVYHPFEVGRDRSGLVFVVFLGAHLALGIGWRTAWCIVFPLLPGIAGVIVARQVDEPIGVFIAIAAIPVAIAIVAGGRLMRWVLGRVRADANVVAAALLVIAALPLADAMAESHRLATGPRLPAALAAHLPVDDDLAGACGHYLARRERARLTVEGRALARAVRDRPDAVLTRTISYEDDAQAHDERLTIRQLAEEQLDGLRNAEDELGGCPAELERSLASALSG